MALTYSASLIVGLAAGTKICINTRKIAVTVRSPAARIAPIRSTLASQWIKSSLGDGAPWIWKLAQEHVPNAVQIVDLWHGREHVWKVARAAFPPGSLQAVSWAEHACSLLVPGNIEELVTEIALLPEMPPESGAVRSVPHIEMNYCIGNAARMRYPAFRAQGMHVGSGIAEAACKTVVSTRAKRCGMRWSAPGLDAVPALHTSVLYRAYDDFCKDRSCLVA